MLELAPYLSISQIAYSTFYMKLKLFSIRYAIGNQFICVWTYVFNTPYKYRCEMRIEK